MNKKTDMTLAQQLMKQATSANIKTRLFEIDNIEFKGLFAKSFTAREMRELLSTTDAWNDKYDDGYNDDRAICLQIFDENGDAVFDPDNLEHVKFLANMLFSDRKNIADAVNMANDGGWLKNFLATEKSSS